MHPRRTLALVSALAAHALGQSPSAADALAVEEVTVFKDGHAMIYRVGTLPTDEAGHVTLGDLPQPVLGTFWAFENQAGADLAAVRAGRVERDEGRPAGSLHDLLRLSVGKRIAWIDPQRTERTGRVEALLPSADTPSLALIGHSGGHEAVPIAQLGAVRFLDGLDAGATLPDPKEHPRLTIELDWDDSPRPGESAQVGVMYLQKGLRWIPSYRVTLLDDGVSARVELQGSLINDLIDLSDTTVHLVVGVPRFEFDHTPDPIALNDQFAQLGSYFQRQAGTAGAFSNALMAQSMRMQEARAPAPASGGAATPEVSGAESNEDLYVFSVDRVTLGVGERMIVPIAQAVVPVESVYKLAIQASPPFQTMRNFNTQQQREIAAMLERPRARHVLRMRNTGEHPFTTAPALIVRDGQTLAQGLMLYTARGAEVDLEVTDAVDIQVETQESESGREANGVVWHDDRYARIDLQWTVELTNRKAEGVTVEVTKHAFGLPVNASEGGQADALGMFEDARLWASSGPAWWHYYGLPWWWSRINGVSRFTWTVQLEPGESLERSARWHYFWR